MSLKIKVLVPLFAAQLAIVFLAMKLGDTALGWGASIGTALLSLSLLYFIIRTELLHPLNQLSNTIRTVRMEGNLSLHADLSGATDESARSFNDLMENIQSIIGKVIFNSNQVANSAQSLDGMARKVATSSNDQQGAAEAIGQAIRQMITNIQDIAGHARLAAENARESRQLSGDGAIKAQHAADEIERIAQAFEDSATSINHLGERTQRINGIAGTISKIADQTNLLALNAAIEAARAGESGRGFAVVADEVRKLAENTSAATREISLMIGSIQEETNATITKVQSGTVLAHDGAALARNAAEALTHINQSSQNVLDKSDSIAGAISEQTLASELVGKKMLDILELVKSNSSTVQNVMEQSTHLGNLAINLKEIETVFKLGASGLKGVQIHERTPAVVQAAAREIEKLLEQAINSKRITLADLFDEKYERIANIEPPKYHTRFDKLTDELFPRIQEAILDQHPEFVYAGAVDRNGYFPTHNKKFSAPLTGDSKKDMIHSRSKRIFNDPVGKRCGTHKLPFLLQTYRRDTGEVMHDVSTPIYVGGKQWGGFRIGYKA
jgi:methyl-accepting chemotaxis protein